MKHLFICQLLALSSWATARKDLEGLADGGTNVLLKTPALVHSTTHTKLRHLQQEVDTPYGNLPRWSVGSRYEEGPVAPDSLGLTAGNQNKCLTIGEVLDLIPNASRFSQLLTYSGLKNVLLDDPKVMTTLIVPQDAAFFAPLPEPSEYGSNMSALIENRPDVINSLIGASVWKGLYPSTTLRSGVSIQTSNSIGGMGAPPLEVEIEKRQEDISIRAQGSTATIVAKDIAACGPSVIHIVDTILLPFSFDGQPQDRLDPQNSGGAQVDIDTQDKIAQEQIVNTDFNWRQFFG